MKDDFINCIADLEQAVRDTSYSLEKEPYTFNRDRYQLKQYNKTIVEAVIGQWGLSTFRYRGHVYAKRSEITAVIDKAIETQLIDGFCDFNCNREYFLQWQKQKNFEQTLKECYDLLESAKRPGHLKITMNLKEEKLIMLDQIDIITNEFILVYTAVIDGTKQIEYTYEPALTACLKYNGKLYDDRNYNFNCFHGKMLEVKMKWLAREMGARA